MSLGANGLFSRLSPNRDGQSDVPAMPDKENNARVTLMLKQHTV